ncbi:hypothetical protein BX666DRAFT_2003604 [Dichotomocladium elegans]|nr:hypothetical protein BX666DRAFT_2003604 [Dichotomocladium elegans]
MTSSFNYESVAPRGLSIAQQRDIAARQAQEAAKDRTYHPSPKPFPGSASLYVGELDLNVQESQLYDIFSDIGPVESVRVCRDAITRQSLGYAFVSFKSQVDGERALRALNSTFINGKPCRIMWSQRDYAKRKLSGGNIFVKNLDPSITSKSLRDTFAQYGSIVSCKVVQDSQGQSKGYGFILYDTVEAAENAIRHVNGTTIHDRELYVGHHIPKRERQQQQRTQRFTNVYVKNLMPDIKEEELKDLFSGFGPILTVLIQRDELGHSKGFGFVNFERHEDAERAVQQMNDAEYIGRRLIVSRAQKKSEREQEQHAVSHDGNNTCTAVGNGTPKHHRYQGMNLYIKNLDDDIDDHRLREEFSRFGTITSAKVMRDEKTGLSKGYGFVCFTVPQEAAMAVQEMNGRMLGSKAAYVAMAQRKEDRRHFDQQQQRQLYLQQPLIPIPGTYNPIYYDYNGFQHSDMASARPPQPSTSIRYPPPAFSKQGYHVPIPAYYMPPAVVSTREVYPFSSLPGHRDQQSGDLTLEMVESCPPELQNQVLGERIYAVVKEKYPEEAGKVTGMLLEMDKEDLVALINEREALESKADEAVAVLEEHRATHSAER